MGSSRGRFTAVLQPFWCLWRHREAIGKALEAMKHRHNKISLEKESTEGGEVMNMHACRVVGDFPVEHDDLKIFKDI